MTSPWRSAALLTVCVGLAGAPGACRQPAAPAPLGTDDAIARRAGVEPEVVLIPAGPFLMGTSETHAARLLRLGGSDWVEYVSWQQPQHVVHLSAFEIGRYPVTDAQYMIFVEATGHRRPVHWDDERNLSAGGNLPVGNVGWHDAIAYCRWLARVTGKAWRLPTEAEWEKAARGEDGRFYPWGDTWDPRRLNSREEGPGRLTRVGRYSPSGDSPYGVADMAGNLWEWTADWFRADEFGRRADTDVRDPLGPDAGEFRVLRGGAFNLDGLLLSHVAIRDCNDPDEFAIDDGFRIARTVVYPTDHVASVSLAECGDQIAPHSPPSSGGTVNSIGGSSMRS